MNFFYLLFFFLVGSSFSLNEGLRMEKIIGGTPAHRSEFRYTVAVMYNSSGKYDHNPCTGSILSDWYIVTVAHCFYDEIFGEWRNRYYYIVVGVQNLLNQLPTTRHISVDTVTIPKMFNMNITDKYAIQGNLAMVKLNESLELRPNHPTLAKLHPRQRHFRNLEGVFYVSSFGFQEIDVYQEEIHGILQNLQKGSSDGKLRYAKGKILSNLQCSKIFNDNLAPGNMCVKLIEPDPNEPVGICKHDSGAPLVHHFYLDAIAITSGDITCNENKKPGVYLSVLEYSIFIKDILDGRKPHNMFIIKQKQDNEGQFSFINLEEDELEKN